MLYLFILIAIFISWIWVDYFRLLDLFETENLKNILVAFIVGCATVSFVVSLHKLDIIALLAYNSSYNFIDLLYHNIIEVGVVEELCKLMGFGIVFSFLKKEFNEPMDYMIYMSVVALGFAAFENVFYFMEYGFSSVFSRSVLSSVGHMLFSSFMAYGIILNRYRYHTRKLERSILFFSLAALSHGSYDFMLTYRGFPLLNVLLFTGGFLAHVSLYANMLNSALNNSPYFTYKKVVNRDKISQSLMVYYGVIYVISSLWFIAQSMDKIEILNHFLFSYIILFFLIIMILRLSRFTLIHHRWIPLKLELPFQVIFNQKSNRYGGSFHLKMKGSDFNEVYIHRYYEQFLIIHPISKKRGVLSNPLLAYMHGKTYLPQDEAVYKINILLDKEGKNHVPAVVKPKKEGKTMYSKKTPIVGLYKYKEFSEKLISMEQLEFIEWGYLEYIDKKEDNEFRETISPK